MDYKKLTEIAEKLEEKHIVGSAKGIQESKEILAMTQYYRVHSANIETVEETVCPDCGSAKEHIVLKF
jgi:hypothetical protein